MKSKIRKNMVVKSEIKPRTSVLNPAFVYTGRASTDIAATFARIRAEMQQRGVGNVTPIVKKTIGKKS